MQEENFIPVNLPVKSLIEAIEYLEIEQLLELRHCIDQQVTLLQQSRELFSQVGIDYQPLKDALVAEDWRAASRITIELMEDAASARQIGDAGILVDEADNFPIGDINTINYLWIKYSHGRFGFSVQQRIWEESGRNREQLGELMGWKVQERWLREDELQFTSNAPLGHLPFVPAGLKYEVSSLEPECFTDSYEMGSSFGFIERVEPIELWQALINLVDDDLSGI